MFIQNWIKIDFLNDSNITPLSIDLEKSFQDNTQFSSIIINNNKNYLNCKFYIFNFLPFYYRIKSKYNGNNF